MTSMFVYLDEYIGKHVFMCINCDWFVPESRRNRVNHNFTALKWFICCNWVEKWIIQASATQFTQTSWLSNDNVRMHFKRKCQNIETNPKTESWCNMQFVIMLRMRRNFIIIGFDTQLPLAEYDCQYTRKKWEPGKERCLFLTLPSFSSSTSRYLHLARPFFLSSVCSAFLLSVHVHTRFGS